MRDHVDLLARAGSDYADAVLGREWGVIADRWLEDVVDAGSTPAGRAADAAPVRGRVGGDWHRLRDGGRDLSGTAGSARRRALDEGLVEQLGIYGREVRKDLTTPAGLSALTRDATALDALSGILQANLRVGSAWVNGTARLTATEFGGVIASVATLLLSVRASDPRRYSELCGSLGLSAMIPANPVLPAVWLAVILGSFHDRGLVASGWSGLALARGALTACVLVPAVVALGPLGLAPAVPAAYLVRGLLRRLSAERGRMRARDALAALRAELIDARPTAQPVQSRPANLVPVRPTT